MGWGTRCRPARNSFRINAYVSSETDNPAIDFDGGYANLDDEGFPYLVISANIFGEEPFFDRLQSVLSHEFYHDIQFGTTAYQAESAYWYWEATAEWASQQLYPDLDAAYTFVGAYALATELPVFYAGDAFGDSPSGVHQYGASIFARHLTDRLELPSLVPESWEAAGAEDDPLDVLDGLLPGGDIAAAYIEFAPHMALWDFTRRDLILPWIRDVHRALPCHRPARLEDRPGRHQRLDDRAGRARTARVRRQRHRDRAPGVGRARSRGRGRRGRLARHTGSARGHRGAPG